MYKVANANYFSEENIDANFNLLLSHSAVTAVLQEQGLNVSGKRLGRGGGGTVYNLSLVSNLYLICLFYIYLSIYKNK